MKNSLESQPNNTDTTQPENRGESRESETETIEAMAERLRGMDRDGMRSTTEEVAES